MSVIEASAPTPARRARTARLRRTLPGAAVTALALMVPLQVTTGYDLSRFQLTFVYMIAAMTLNFAFGYAGQLALGQPVLVGVAAYTAGMLSRHHGWAVHATLWPAIAVTMTVSVLLGLPSLRVRGWYFAVLTFFGILVFPELIVALRTWTGGEDGLIGIAPIRWAGDRLDLRLQYELVLIAVILTWVVIRNAVRSDWGIALQAMRDHPLATSAAGISVGGAKSRVYLLTALPCAVAGVAFAHTSEFVAPEQFGFDMILLLLGGVFIGGLGTLWGPIVGVALFQGISLWIGPFSEYNPLVLGLGVLASAVVFRGGLVPTVRRLIRRDAPATTDSELTDGGAQLALEAVAGAASVEARGVELAFGAHQVLAGVDLTLAGGEVTALVGANGSGKTTLLNVLSGFYTPQAGAVTVNGADCTSLPPVRIARAGLGRTFQVPKLVDDLTVGENIQLGIIGIQPQRALAAVLRLPGFRARMRAQQAAAAEIARGLGFSDDVIASRAGTLSLGLKRIVEIGRAIAGDARVICLDEPAAGLNDDERERLATVCRTLAGSGRAVLLIEHHLRFVLEVSDRVVLLEEGTVAGEGRPDQPGEFGPALTRYFGTYLVDFDRETALAIDA